MVKVVGNLIAVFVQGVGQESTPSDIGLSILSAWGHRIYFIMTTGEIALPLDLMLGIHQDGKKTTAPEYKQKLQSRLRTCFEEVRTQLKKYEEKRKKYTEILY